MQNTTETLTATLAWEFNEKVRQGTQVTVNHYLQKLPDAASRQAFLEAVEMSALVDAMVEFQAETPGDQVDSVPCDSLPLHQVTTATEH